MLVVLGIGVTVGVLALASAACIVPLQFEEQRDSGVDDNYPPVITASDPEMPGPTPLDTAITPAVDFTVDVEDKDLDDTIFVRVFRAGTEPPFADVDKPKNGQATRTLIVSTAGWCAGATPGQQITFEVMVADREFLDPPAEPLYQALPDGAESSRSFWLVQCQ